MAGIRNIYGAPNGVYRDGGLFDYHLNEEYAHRREDLTLLFHHQDRIVPGWLDQKFKSRTAQPAMLENLVMVYPSENFIKRLPNGKVPDREDFVAYADHPEDRMENWRRAAKLCEPLGEQFLELVESRRIQEVVQKF